MTDLADADDVALALGLADSEGLSEAQARRVAPLLSRVSHEFRREADRVFTPGTSTLRLLTVAGRVRLVEPIGTVVSATMQDRDGTDLALSAVVDGQFLELEYAGRRLGSGVLVTVTYTHTAPVPDDVVAAVAAIVARHLTVDPSMGPVTEMSAGPFRQRLADWTNTSALLTADDCATARRYRYPGSTVIVQQP